MADSPGLLTRVVAGFKKEVPAKTLESIQKAGIGVYRALDDAEAVRRDLAAKGCGCGNWVSAADLQVDGSSTVR